MTDTTVIQPGAGQAILTTDHHDHDRGRHYGHGYYDRERGPEILREQSAFGRQAANDAQTIVRDVKDTRFDLAQTTGRQTSDLAQAICRTDELVQSGFGGVHDRLCDATSKVVHEIDRHGDASALAACKVNDAIAEGKLFNAVQFKDQIIAQDKNAAAQNVLSTTIGNAAQVLATSFANQASIQATSNFNLLTVQLERTRAELDSKVAAGFAAATLLAFQNKCDSDAKAAECCCELKELIRAEGVAGRALANEIEARRVANELQRLQTQVAVLTGGIVGARTA